jgi:hypothetical protein
VAYVEIAAGQQHLRFDRQSGGGWLLDDAPARALVAVHLAAALRIVAVLAPRRVLKDGQYSAGQLAEFGLDPPRLEVALAEAGGNAAHVGIGADTAAENAQYVRILGRSQVYIMPRVFGEEWQLVRDMATRAPSLLLPISISQIWAIEIVRSGVLTRFERDPAGLWFHHVPHPNQPGLSHRADPKLAPLIAAQFDALDRTPIAGTTASRPAALGADGLVHPATILLLYSRDSAGPVARVELGNTLADGSGRWAHLQHSDNLVTIPAGSERTITALLQLAGVTT